MFGDFQRFFAVMPRHEIGCAAAKVQSLSAFAISASRRKYRANTRATLQALAQLTNNNNDFVL